MANARLPDRAGRHVHDADIMGGIGPLGHATPAESTRGPQSSLRIELGIVIFVGAVRLPCEFRGRSAGRLWGRGSRQSRPPPSITLKPGRRETARLRLFSRRKLLLGSLPSGVGEAHAGRPGRPGTGIEDPALDGTSPIGRLADGSSRMELKRGRDAADRARRVCGRPAVKLAVLDHQRGPHVALEVEHRRETSAPTGAAPGW